MVKLTRKLKMKVLTFISLKALAGRRTANSLCCDTTQFGLACATATPHFVFELLKRLRSSYIEEMILSSVSPAAAQPQYFGMQVQERI